MSAEAINLLKRIAVAVEMIAGVRTADAGGEVADDRDLDSPYGDPVVKFNPRDWRGDSCKGLPLSQCPPEFLDLLAGAFEYFARQAEKNQEVTASGKAVAPYKRKDAARCRGWAARIRSGTAAVADAPVGGFDVSGFEDAPADDAIPF